MKGVEQLKVVRNTTSDLKSSTKKERQSIVVSPLLCFFLEQLVGVRRCELLHRSPSDRIQPRCLQVLQHKKTAARGHKQMQLRAWKMFGNDELTSCSIFKIQNVSAFTERGAKHGQR